MARQFEEQLLEEVNSEYLFEAFRDTQNKLNIITKNTNTTLPRFITVSRLPSPELFMPSLEQELAEKDITDEERQAQAEAERKAQEEAEAKAKAEEEARLEAERLAKEEEERKAQEEAEAKAKAEEEARLEAERLEQERLEAEKKAQEEAEAQAKAEEEARLEAERLEQERIEAEKKAQEEQPNVDENPEEVVEETPEEEPKAEEPIEEQPEVDEAPEETVEEPSEEPVVEEQPAEEESQQEQPEVEQPTEEETPEEEPKAEEPVVEEPAPQPVVEEKPVKKQPPQQEQISIISFATLKGKKKPIAKMSTMQAGGIAAAKVEHAKQKEELDAIRKEEASIRAEQRKAEREKEALERLPNAILIGNTKVPSPELGKFEIANSKDVEKPFKLLLRTEKGQVVFETSPMRTKPNELTAVMFKDIMNTGSFTFTRSINGFAFQILDSRKRVFYTSRSFINLNDAKRAAALIKKYGLSANYIDDTTI